MTYHILYSFRTLVALSRTVWISGSCLCDCCGTVVIHHVGWSNVAVSTGRVHWLHEAHLYRL